MLSPAMHEVVRGCVSASTPTPLSAANNKSRLASEPRYPIERHLLRHPLGAYRALPVWKLALLSVWLCLPVECLLSQTSSPPSTSTPSPSDTTPASSAAPSGSPAASAAPTACAAFGPFGPPNGSGGSASATTSQSTTVSVQQSGDTVKAPAPRAGGAGGGAGTTSLIAIWPLPAAKPDLDAHDIAAALQNKMPGHAMCCRTRATL
jgi:hypothetical protein